MFQFLKQFIKHPRQTGAIAKFSDYSIQQVLSHIPWWSCLRIVELWGGQGFITKSILHHLSPESTLDCFEINTEFSKLLSTIDDKRLTIINDTVLHLESYYEKESIDYIISSLPITLFNDDDVDFLFRQVNSCLKKDGLFIQLQYSTIQKKIIAHHFPQYTTQRELKNLPPACIFTCKKQTP